MVTIDDFVSVYWWQLAVWIAAGGFGVVLAFAIGYGFGRRAGYYEAPHTLREELTKVKADLAAEIVVRHSMERHEAVIEEKLARVRGTRDALLEAME